VKFRDAPRRLGHPLIIEQKLRRWTLAFTHQLQVINDSRVDGIVIWGDAAAAGTILKEMRQVGMKQPMFGRYRALEDDRASPVTAPKGWRSSIRSIPLATIRRG
jgi:hypothetical protein